MKTKKAVSCINCSM